MNLPKASSEVAKGSDRLIADAFQNVMHRRLGTAATNAGDFADEDSRLRLLIGFISEQHPDAKIGDRRDIGQNDHTVQQN